MSAPGFGSCNWPYCNFNNIVKIVQPYLMPEQYMTCTTDDNIHFVYCANLQMLACSNAKLRRWPCQTIYPMNFSQVYLKLMFILLET